MDGLYGNIKIDNGLRKIGVNDDGEYIELSVNDKTLTERFAGLLKWLDEQQEAIDRRGKELAEKYGNGPIIEAQEDGGVSVNTGALAAVTKTETDIYRECCKKLDEVFGEDTCRKVFGNIVPGTELIEDFLEQMAPILEKMSAERGEKIQLRYDRRKKKNRQRSKEQLINDHKGK